MVYKIKKGSNVAYCCDVERKKLQNRISRIHGQIHSLKNKFDELSPLMNEVVTEIDAKVSKKIGISFSFQEELMNDIKNIDSFKNSLNEKMNNNKLNA